MKNEINPKKAAKNMNSLNANKEKVKKKISKWWMGNGKLYNQLPKKSDTKIIATLFNSR